MAKKKNFKVMIKSDGTSGGTSLVINGVDITKKYNVMDIYFSAYPSYKDPSSASQTQNIYINWTIMEKDEDNVEKTATYRYSPVNRVVYRVPIGKTSIGDSAEPQFLTDSDQRHYDLTQEFSPIEDVCEVVDLSIKDNKE